MGENSSGSAKVNGHSRSPWMPGPGQRRQEAARIIDEMMAGATLQIVFTQTGSHWLLSTGERVASGTALAVVNDVRIVGDGGLYDGASQTWRCTRS
jgi:hypothetical protein